VQSPIKSPQIYQYYVLTDQLKALCEAVQMNQYSMLLELTWIARQTRKKKFDACRMPESYLYRKSKVTTRVVCITNTCLSTGKSVEMLGGWQHKHLSNEMRNEVVNTEVPIF